MREGLTHELVRTQAPLVLAGERTPSSSRVIARRNRREILASLCIVAIMLEGVWTCALSQVAPLLTLVLASPLLLAWLPWWPEERTTRKP